MDRKSLSVSFAGPKRSQWPLAIKARRSSLSKLLTCSLAMLVVVASGSCRKRHPPKRLDTAQIEAWADLPGARAAQDAALQVELAKVIEGGGTPRQLTPSPLPEEENVAAALLHLFDTPQLERGLLRAEQLMPGDTFELDAQRRSEVESFLPSYTKQLRELEAALRRPACQFATRFERGYFAARPYTDVVTLCVQLEALRVAELLDQNRPHAAVAPLQAMFRLTALLAADKLVASRLTAARLRGVTLAALARWVKQPQLTHDDLLGMSQTLEHLLNHWPDDAAAWVGDRGLALHSYEAIRSGHLLSLLTPEEANSLQTEGLLDGLPERLAKSIDRDERFYLEAMRKIIASCELPYYQRRKELTEIGLQLQTRRNSPDFPFVAGRLFLAGIEQGHRQQAEDRARCEAWSLALALAADQPRPPYRTSPLTGIVYAVDVTPQRVKVVTGPGGNMIIEVPRRMAR